MREIKFRAWLKEKKKMLSSRNLQELRFDERYEPGYSVVFEGSGLINGTNVELMQFTGLKNKNGKEIYEGDVVEEKAKGKEYRLTEVKWNKGNMGFYFSNSGTNFIEVIGNIYENPELLTK